MIDRRSRTLTGLVVCLPVAATLIVPPVPRLLWNATASAPVGLYLVTPGQQTHRGEFAIAWLPPKARMLADHRRYLPASVPLVKPVAATGGDLVCACGVAITVNQRIVAYRLRQDRAGRPLPWWQGCHRLATAQVFLLGIARPDSFDGRYFGPIDRDALIGTARPLWVR